MTNVTRNRNRGFSVLANEKLQIEGSAFRKYRRRYRRIRRVEIISIQSGLETKQTIH